MTEAGAPPGSADEVVTLVRDGQSQFASGELEKARQSFAKALALRPEDTGARAGLERCDKLLSERAKPQADAGSTPAWPSDISHPDDFPDSGEAPEATIVDPNYLMDMTSGPGRDASSSGEFPEPLTMPRGKALEPRAPEGGNNDARRRSGESPAAADPRPGQGAATPPPGELRAGPSYPRYMPTNPGNYPEVRPGGRGPSPSPPPVVGIFPTPPPGQLGPPIVGVAGPPLVAYPQVPPGGVSAYPHYATPVGGPYLPGPATAPVTLGPPRRWMLITASVGVGCILLGLLLGWAIFGAGDEASNPVDATPAVGAPASKGGPAPPPSPP